MIKLSQRRLTVRPLQQEYPNDAQRHKVDCKKIEAAAANQFEQEKKADKTDDERGEEAEHESCR
jgi:hypothetical protein